MENTVLYLECSTSPKDKTGKLSVLRGHSSMPRRADIISRHGRFSCCQPTGEYSVLLQKTRKKQGWMKLTRNA